MGPKTTRAARETSKKTPRDAPRHPQDVAKKLSKHTQDDPKTISIPKTIQDGHKTPKRHLLSSSWRQLRAILAPTCTILGPFWPPQIASQDGVQHRAILGSILGWFLRGGWKEKTYKNLRKTLLFTSKKTCLEQRTGSALRNRPCVMF